MSKKTCSTDGCRTQLWWAEEYGRGTCAVCAARSSYRPKQKPTRYALVPGLLELYDIAEEMQTIPGVPERFRGRSIRMQEILAQLIQHLRVGVSNPQVLDRQLQALIMSEPEGEHRPTFTAERLCTLPNGYLELHHTGGGKYELHGVIDRKKPVE